MFWPFSAFLKLGLKFCSQNLCDIPLSWFPFTFLAIFFSFWFFLAPSSWINLPQGFQSVIVCFLLYMLSSQVIASLFQGFEYYPYVFNHPINVCNPEPPSELHGECPRLMSHKPLKPNICKTEFFISPQKPGLSLCISQEIARNLGTVLEFFHSLSPHRQFVNIFHLYLNFCSLGQDRVTIDSYFPRTDGGYACCPGIIDTGTVCFFIL